MKCCGQDPKTTQIQIAGRSYVLYRCGDCNRRTWLRDGGVVPFTDVSAAMQADATMITNARSKAARQRLPI